jgi:hypothetical protein
MYIPIGLTRTQTIAKISAVCNHPTTVIVPAPFLEIFRAEHCVRQIDEREDGQNQADDQIEGHSRSHPIT